MPSCVVRGCKRCDTKVKKERGISYHRFPNDLTRQELWTRIIRKQRNDPYFKPHKDSRICSAHFYDKDIEISKSGLRRIKESAIPRFETEVSEKELITLLLAQSGKRSVQFVTDFNDIDQSSASNAEIPSYTRRERNLLNKLKYAEFTIEKQRLRIKRLSELNLRKLQKMKVLMSIIDDLRKNSVSNNEQSSLETETYLHSEDDVQPKIENSDSNNEQSALDTETYLHSEADMQPKIEFDN